MRNTLLIIIKAYWYLIPAKNRARCIFRESCSNHVFNKTKIEGFASGLKALRFRYKNCRPGYHLMTVNNETILVTVNNETILEKDIDFRLLTQQNL
ncbi:membrane protein insertion efficiency factor YidD [Flavihalobacter algicola]|uniref:Membrane protein insertion efficiency factor YidD n=2 Tax=Psychroserpens algicola TaxID=1719034 RepID=A0ABT0H976_9FLAO|nr:membrane protein insertion efficiency factor YidD [Psychroserpens algicola]MCK8480919.1 membrane protein insertion efficiency factor YidD [Psychroserpens algicola]